MCVEKREMKCEKMTHAMRAFKHYFPTKSFWFSIRQLFFVLNHVYSGEVSHTQHIFFDIFHVFLGFRYYYFFFLHEVASAADVGWTLSYFQNKQTKKKRSETFLLTNDYVSWPSLYASCNKNDVKQWMGSKAWVMRRAICGINVSGNQKKNN